MPQSRSAGEIEAWLISYIANLVNVSPAEIDVEEPFASLGISSAEAVILTGDVQLWLDIVLDPTLAWEHPTIRESARQIASQLEAARRKA